MEQAEKRANILIEALPYIKEYNKKIVVVKYGGNAMVNKELKIAVMEDIILLHLVGIKVVLVHGGGPEISKMLAKLNIESVFSDGLRITDKETVKVAQMVLAGTVNKDLVALINAKGGNALGLSGIDGHLLKVECLNDKLGYVGKITECNPQIVLDILNNGYIPVISSIGTNLKGEVFNINADTVAAEIASAIKAESLILLTDTKGILSNKDDESSLIDTFYVKDIENYKNEKIIVGGMIPKVECCKYALDKGVNKTFIIDGRVPHSLLIEILTNQGIGTMCIK
ncbi:MAG: acetylglutamate kinase [Clostridia bacterium]